MLPGRHSHRLLTSKSRIARPLPPSVRLQLRQTSSLRATKLQQPPPRRMQRGIPAPSPRTQSTLRSVMGQTQPDERPSPTHTPPSDDDIAQLRQYSACDISDALLKLKVPGSGFIPDLAACTSLGMRTSGGSGGNGTSPAAVSIAPISTILFAPRTHDSEAEAEARATGARTGTTAAGLHGDRLPANNIPNDAHWADLTEPGTFVILKQPPGQANAVCGGIMALRMKMRQVSGIVVLGRVRDVDDLRSTGLPIWALGTSTVGAAAGCIPWATQVPIRFDEVILHPGDIAFHDPDNGIVFIPRDKVARVLEILPGMVAADARVKEDLLQGMSVHSAFKLHRA